MADTVELVGYVPHTAPSLVGLFRDADVFALPCANNNGQKEGIPSALVEAMAAGLPIVSTRHGGIPAVVTDRREGLLCREGDISQLADALEHVLVDAELRQALGTAAAARATRELDVALANEELELIYDEFCDRLA